MLRVRDTETFRAALIERGLTQNELARAVGTTTGGMSAKINRKKRVYPAEAELIARVLAVPMAVLFVDDLNKTEARYDQRLRQHEPAS